MGSHLTTFAQNVINISSSGQFVPISNTIITAGLRNRGKMRLNDNLSQSAIVNWSINGRLLGFALEPLTPVTLAGLTALSEVPFFGLVDLLMPPSRPKSLNLRLSRATSNCACGCSQQKNDRFQRFACAIAIY